MDLKNTDGIEKIRYLIYETTIFAILLICIIIWSVNFQQNTCWWIWIVNYIGMAVAFINLFINKVLILYNKNSPKFKPFFGLTFFVVITVILLGFYVSTLQSKEVCELVNDVITLLALFFSLSPRIWNVILNIITEVIK